MAWIIGLAMSAAWFAAMVATGASLKASRLEEEVRRLDSLVLKMGNVVEEHVIELAEERAAEGEDRYSVSYPDVFSRN